MRRLHKPVSRRQVEREERRGVGGARLDEIPARIFVRVATEVQTIPVSKPEIWQACDESTQEFIRHIAEHFSINGIERDNLRYTKSD